MTNKNQQFKLRLLILSLIFLSISCTSDEINTSENQLANITLLTKIDVTDIIIGSEILIETDIEDEDGEVKKASLLINCEIIQTITSEPFNFKWDTSLESTGEYQIKIVAQDDDEGVSDLETIVVLTENFICGKDFFDPRDGNIYKTVQIGDQCWMAQNLNYKTEEGNWDYDDNPENGEKYGKLYNREAALMASPDGWHLPSDEEWKVLEGTVDTQLEVGSEEWNEWSYRGVDAGKNLKSESDWEENGNGINKFSFNALPGGYKFLDPGPGSDYYENLNFSAPFWTSTSPGGNQLWGRELFSTKNNIHRTFYNDDWALGIRCIKD